MEEKAFSSEQPEEVIELLDIVGQTCSEETGSVSGQESPAPTVAEEEKFAAEPSGEEYSGPEAIHSSPEESLLQPCEGEDEPSLERQSDKAPVGEENVEPEVLPSEKADVSAEEEGALRSLEERHRAEVRALEERLAAAEKVCAELAESVESLSQQLAQAGAMFMEDASVRLNMEEMVSRMLDDRLPSAEEQEGSSGEGDLAVRLEELERRMEEGQARSEQLAALAAAKVIREEIAAIKAEYAHSAS